MHVMTANYNANPNIGLFCYATDKYCLVPYGFQEKLKKAFEEIFNVPVYEMRAAGTDLLGVFFAGTDDVLLVPEIMFDSELKLLEEHGIRYHVVKSELTALGNNMLLTKEAGMVNPDYDDKVIEELEKVLGIKIKKGKISEVEIVGALAVMNSKGCLITDFAKPFEKKFLEDTFKVSAVTGTVNFGSPYVKSGIVCNSNGFVIGDASGGPEIQNADEALGFLE